MRGGGVWMAVPRSHRTAPLVRDGHLWQPGKSETLRRKTHRPRLTRSAMRATCRCATASSLSKPGRPPIGSGEELDAEVGGASHDREQCERPVTGAGDMSVGEAE